MRHLIIFLVTALIPAALLAGNGNWEKRINLLDLQTGVIYGVQEPARTSGQDTKLVSKLNGYLFLDYTRKEQSDLNVVAPANFWRMWVKYHIGSNPTQYQLQISYENGNYVYSDYAPVTITNNGYEITVDKVEGSYSNNGTSWTAVANAASSPYIPNDIDLRLELRSETVYAMDPGVVADQSRMAFNSSSFRVNWSYVEGAEWYDLEWIFIDKYSAEYTTLATTFTGSADLSSSYDLPFKLGKGMTRVRVWGTNYTLDKAYPEGTIYFRVRSVSNFTASGSSIDQIKTGTWNYFSNPANYGTGIDVTDLVRYEVLSTQEFESHKNWLYTAAFAEGGKSVSSITYYDGSNRGRQNITYNTSDNISLVGETKFDYEGRQTVSVVPAPVSGRQLGYRTNFNLASVGDVFDEEDFDMASPTTPVPPLYSPPASSGVSGAAQYFSPNNAFPNDLYRAAIPDAGGYVFSQTIYRNDGSGRIERIGGVGADFKASGTHAVQTFYGSPTETELKRLFGSNVSNDPTGYRKELVRDANGQYSVTYYDKRGHVIATGLTGDSPSSLRPIEVDAEQLITTDLSDNNIVVNGGKIVSEHTFLNAKVNNSVTLTYSLTGLVNTLAAQTVTVGNQSISIGQLCTTCHYDLTIQVLKGDGTDAVTPITASIDPAACVAAGYTYTSPAIVLALPGEYRIIKTLTVDYDAMQLEFTNLLNSQGLSNSTTFIANYVQQVDLSGCFDNCDDYCKALWKLGYIQANNVTDIQAESQWTNVLTESERETILATCSQDVCNPDELNEDFGGTDEPSMTVCSSLRDAAIDQISPGGVFYDNPNSAFWSTIPLTINGQTYTLAQLHDPNVYTSDMAAWLVDNGYHRESCHLLSRCESWSNSTTYSVGLTSTIMNATWSTTSTTFTAPYSSDVYGWLEDPFISSVFNGSSLLQNALTNYMANQYALGGSWGCTGVTWPTTGTLADYVENYVACMITLDPTMTADEIAQMKKSLFLGLYNQLKEKLIASYNSGIGCAYYDDDNALFHAPPSQQDMEDEISATLSNILNPQDCDGKAWNQTVNWMAQIPNTCLVSLGMLQTVNGDLVPTYTQQDLIDAYAGTGGATVNTLAEYFYAYSMKVCPTNTWGWFYNPDLPSGVQPGETEYNAILSLLSGTACGTGVLSSFQVTPPATTTAPVMNSVFSDCFMDFFGLMNEGLAQLNTCAPCTSTIVSVTSTNHPGMFADCSVAPSGNLVSGTMNVGVSSGQYTLTYISNLAACRSTLLLYSLTPPYLALAPPVAIDHLENPVKLLQYGINPIIGFDVVLIDGTVMQGYIDVKDLNCINLGAFTSGQTLSDLDGAVITLPNYTVDCIAAETAQATIDAQTLYNDLLNNLQNQFLSAANNCLNVTETLTLSYSLKEYQYTLYYYDLAGNLVQTVPPQGVQILSSADAASGLSPVHKMETRYQYNGLNALIASYAPDGDRSDLSLDKLYRVRFSQNKRQVNERKASYAKYDPLGRTTEAGEVKLAASVTDVPAFLATKVEDNTWPGTADYRLDYTETVYEDVYMVSAGTPEPTIAATFGSTGQENLRNAIGAIVHYQVDLDQTSGLPTESTRVKTVLSYSYDVHKNVKRLVSSNFQLASIGQHNKVVDYQYDLISGVVKEAAYQTGKLDESRQRYHYDANNRLIRALTSKDNVQWEMDAKYFYYLHGALARVETGHDKVQGTDYAYNIQGWLKGVNSATLLNDHDLGKDGYTGLNKYSGSDAIGFQLGYFNGDYTPIGTITAFAETGGLTSFNVNPDASGASMGSLYNGNITHMITAIRKTDETVLDILGNNYQYDQLERIRDMKAYLPGNLYTENNFSESDLYHVVGLQGAYQESYTFDKNGNLKTLTRNGSGRNDAGGTVPLEMDNFTYYYYNDLTSGSATSTAPSNTNRLAQVKDVNPGSVTNYDNNYTGDINAGDVSGTNPVQPATNYQYDATGQLISDVQEGIARIDWTATGKVKAMTFTTASAKKDLKFIYDPLDQRVIKMEYQNTAHSWIKYTYYAYDASGNVLATYTRETKKITDNLAARTYTDVYKLAELHIYGTSRIGMEDPNELIVNATIVQQPVAGNPENLETGTSFTWSNTTPLAFDHTNRKVADKFYELSNHLGNVLAVITDRKIEYQTSNTYTADVTSYSDYSPYGMLLQQRHGNEAAYRYGFQDQEMDNEIKGNGNSLNYEYRMHDARVGRFFAIDPLAAKYPWYTPYQFAGNKVIMGRELEGLENETDKQLNQISKYQQYERSKYQNPGYPEANPLGAPLEDYIPLNQNRIIDQNRNPQHFWIPGCLTNGGTPCEFIQYGGWTTTTTTDQSSVTNRTFSSTSTNRIMNNRPLATINNPFVAGTNTPTPAFTGATVAAVRTAFSTPLAGSTMPLLPAVFPPPTVTTLSDNTDTKVKGLTTTTTRIVVTQAVTVINRAFVIPQANVVSVSFASDLSNTPFAVNLFQTRFTALSNSLGNPANLIYNAGANRFNQTFPAGVINTASISMGVLTTFINSPMTITTTTTTTTTTVTTFDFMRDKGNFEYIPTNRTYNR